jgi:hypothetical protein
LTTSFNAVDHPVSITATYNGDSNYNASPTSAAYSQNVYQADTIVTITSVTPSPTVVGQNYSVSGTVTVDSPGGGTPTGTVTVYDGSVTSAAGTVGVDGSWSCSLTSTSAGSKTITATYSGDANYSAPGTAPTTTHTVNPAATTTMVSSSSNPSVTGQGVTFTATITAVSPGSGTPANGTKVTFDVKDSTNAPITGSPFSTTLSSGHATTASITNLDASGSPYTVIATFNPGTPGDIDYDPNYSTSTSAAFTQNVNKANTTTTITGTNLSTPTIVGVSYTVNGTVTVNSPGALPLTAGTVTVSDGTDSYTATTFNVSTGVWSHSFVSTTAGTKTITATYSGDTNFQPSSDTDSHTVNKASTTVAITGTDLGTATDVGVSYTVSGKVTPANTTGTHTTTGTVQVSDATDSCTDTTLTWNASGWWDWSCDLISTTEGSKTITATYFGDANYEDDTTLVGDAAGEQPVAHTVDPASTTTVITSDLSAATVVGEAYTVSGKVTPANTTGTHTTTGTVEVSDVTDTCTDTTLVWNAAGYWDWSCNLISTTAGSKTITAEYSGDTNYSGDKTLAGDSVGERPVAHTVNQASTTVTITGAALDTPTVVGETYTISGRVTPAYTTGTHTNTGTIKVSDGTVADDVIDIPLTWSVDHWEWSTSIFVSKTAGAKTITATFDPTETSTPPGADANYATSQDTESHTVNPADTTTTVTSSVNPSVTGQSVTFTATVVAVAPGSGTPADGTTVTFDVEDSGHTPIAGSPFSTTLSSGQASTAAITGLDASGSPYTVTATFNPGSGTVDPNYDSSSGTLTQNVNKPSTTTTITSDLTTPTVVDASYTVSGTVAVNAPGSLPLVGGTVTVSDGTDSCAASLTLSDGSWSCASFTSTTAGTKTITATYASPDYNGSSDSVSHLVNKGTVTVAVTHTPDPWTDGASGTFTATLTVTTGSGTPSGTVTFQMKDKYGVTIADSGPHALSGASATSNSVTLYDYQSPVSVTATYGGDDFFSASSGSASVTVYPTGFAITGDDPDPSASGEAYTVTWEFASGYTIPTGAYVILSDDAATPATSAHIAATLRTGNLTSTDTAVTTVTATLYDNETDNNVIATDTTPHTVVDRETATAVTGSSDTACISQPVLLTATVTDLSAPPDGPGFTGTVTWTSDGDGTFDPATCDISQGGQCSTYYTPVSSDVGTVNVTASYSGDDAYGSSVSLDFVLHVGKRSTMTTVFGSDTPLVVGDTATFLVTVDDTSSCAPIVPTGEVSVAVSPSGAGILIGAPHALIASDGGQFTFTYKPTSNATTPHTFTATYTGSTTHNGSNGSFNQAIIGRAADIQMSVAPTTAYVYQPVTIAIHVADDTTAGTPSVPTGTVTLAVDDSSGTFIPVSGVYTLDGNGNCTAVYTPDDALLTPYENPLKTISVPRPRL